MTAEPIQLTLKVRLDDASTYENFCSLESLNHPAVLDFLKTQFDGDAAAFGYLWGGAGCGLSHLLQACCHRAYETGRSAQYLPLRAFQEYPADALLEGLAELDLVCLDDIDVIAGDTQREHAVFHLYNQIKERHGQLLVSGNAPPGELGISLADLASRLGWGAVFQLRVPGDSERCRILQFRAKCLGINLTEDVVRYLFNHFERGLPALMTMLEKLDRASLQQQRKITIPFVKTLL